MRIPGVDRWWQGGTAFARRLRAWPWLPALLVLGTLLLLDATLAFARPGGGQDFSGGSSGGGGDDGGVWLVINLAIYLLELCIDYPAVGLPLTGLLIGGVVVWHYVNPNRRTRAAVRDLEASALQGLNPDIRQLADRDPQIAEPAFTAEVAKIVLAVQQAWNGGDMRSARRLLSDGVYNRFTALIAINRARGIRNMTGESTIERPTIISVERDTFFDTIHVRVAGRARDADVPAVADAAQQQKLLGKAKLAKYVEVWSFLRRPGAQTKAGQTIIEGRCPNCGAQQPVGDVVECPFCHALVNSGEYGWVLAEITQASEWRPGSAGARIPGLEDLRAVDPMFNRQQVEDRASFLFWKWIEARVTRNPAAIRKLSTERMSGFVAQEAASGGPGGAQGTMERVAVGSADLAGAEPGGEGGFDRALVRIRWSAAYAAKAAPVPSTNVLVLVRKSGVTTKYGLSGDRCKTCGAPVVTATDSPKCDYCGAELGAGQQDFVLDEVAAPTAVLLQKQQKKGKSWSTGQKPAAAAAPAMMGGGFVMAPMMPMMMPQMPPPMGYAPQPPAPQAAAGYAPPSQAAPMAAAGFAAAPPQAAPPSYAQPTAPQAYTPPAAAPVAPAAPDDEPEDGSPDGIPPWALPDMSNPQERAALLSRMAVIAAADGVVTAQERRLLKKCSKRWGVPFATVEPILKSGAASLQALGPPENPQRFMMGLVAAALIDGKVDRKERMLLDGVAHNMGLDPEVVPGLITAMTEWRNRQPGAQG
jgi:hypothetical protein